MSDTGGGHRGVSEALAAAFASEFGARYDVQMVDAIKTCALFPFNHIPEWYLPFVSFSERAWGWLFHFSNTRAAAPLALALARAVTTRGFKRLLRETSYDLVISVHPVLLSVPRRILRDGRAPTRFAVMVADLIDTHRLWFDPNVDACFVPTPAAREQARRYRVPAEKIVVTGLPVHLKFSPSADDAHLSKPARRAQLGLLDRPTVLLVGGGEGMGPVYEIARQIAQARLPLQLVVVAGRNKKLYDQLAQTAWEIPVCVQGFVTNMPDWMRASAAIITKAGPVTISEALACGLPILLSGFLPGQERGNVDYVVENHVGAYCPSPDQIVRTLREWFAPKSDLLAQYSARACEIARPYAAVEVVRRLDEMLNEPAG